MVQHDGCDDVCEAKRYDNFARIAPISVVPNMCETICVSISKEYRKNTDYYLSDQRVKKDLT